MIVVSNSTPLIGLAMLSKLELLSKLFGVVYIPTAVYNEVVVEGGGQAGATEVAEAEWIKTAQVKDRLAVELLEDELGAGESETIVLAKEVNADWVLMDERTARRKVEALGINRIGTLGILLKAKQTGLLESVRPELDTLRAKGFRISRSLYTLVLDAADEL